MKAGIIGTGAIAYYHVLAINSLEELTLHAACDTNSERLDKFCDEYGCRGFADYRGLVADDIDIAVIALPHALHCEAGMAALDHDCHVMMEKPFAVTMQECRNLYRKAEDKRLKVATAEGACHDPKVLKAAEIARSGSLGRFISGSIINYKDYFRDDRPKWFLAPELAGGGQLINVGVHRIALARAIVGSEEVSVKASVGYFQPGCEVEGNGAIFVGYKDGSAFMLEENGYYKLHPTLEKSCHFNFENGVLNLADKLNVVYKDGSVEEYPDVSGDNENPYLLHYKELLAAIKEGRNPYPGAREGIMDVRVVLAAYESARTGKEVRLDAQTGGYEIEFRIE